MNDMRTFSTAEARVGVNDYVRGVYNWMAAGLGVTGIVAYFVATSPAMLQAIFGSGLFWLLIIAQLGLVFAISGFISRISSGTATGLFLLYSALMGVTLSSIFIIYTSESIVSVFFICAGTFIACSIYGWTTKKDLTSWGSFFFMGLVGIIIASIVNIFMKSSVLHMMISYIGVFVFVGLTIYDTNKIKQMAMSQPADVDASTIRKGAIIGALSLYLDFINLFLMLLRIFGSSRN